MATPNVLVCKSKVVKRLSAHRCSRWHTYVIVFVFVCSTICEDCAASELLLTHKEKFTRASWARKIDCAENMYSMCGPEICP